MFSFDWFDTNCKKVCNFKILFWILSLIEDKLFSIIVRVNIILSKLVISKNYFLRITRY